jgi:hypothetical protein
MNLDPLELQIVNALLEEGISTLDLADFNVKLETTYPLKDDTETRVLTIKGKTEQFGNGQIKFTSLKIGYKDYRDDKQKPFRHHTAIIK